LANPQEEDGGNEFIFQAGKKFHGEGWVDWGMGRCSFPFSGLGTQLFQATLLPVSDPENRETEFRVSLRSQSGDWERDGM